MKIHEGRRMIPVHITHHVTIIIITITHHTTIEKVRLTIESIHMIHLIIIVTGEIVESIIVVEVITMHHLHSTFILTVVDHGVIKTTKSTIISHIIGHIVTEIVGK
jgi:hypothetical protein